MDPNAQTPTAPQQDQTQPVENTPPETPTPENKPKFTKKKILIIIGVVIVIFLLISAITGAYWYGKNSATTTPDVTTYWDTYTNPLYTIKYPPGWTPNEQQLIDNIENPNEVEINAPYYNEDIDEDIYISVSKNPNSLDLYGWLEDNKHLYCFGDSIDTLTKKDMVIENKDAVQFINVAEAESCAPATYIFVVYNDNMFEFSSSAESNERLNIFNQSISTFKTIEPNRYACPTNKSINCMPIIGEDRNEMCDKDYVSWISDNCQDVNILY